MPNINDRIIVTELCQVDTSRRLPPETFEKINQIKDDSTFWQVVATCWIKWGRTKDLAGWKKLFSTNRRGRWHMMKKKDRKVWRSLPKVVTAYRAVAPEEDVDSMISWTLNKEVLERIYKDTREIVTRRFKKEEVIAYFDRRKEHEIIVLGGE